MRYLKVVHEYVIPLDADPSEPDTESVINSGVSMMEAHMRGLSPNMDEVRSHWQWMPKEYKPRSAGALAEIDHHLGDNARRKAHERWENDYPADAPPHPWDQGLWIFPEDHPLARLEREAKHAYDEADDEAHAEELKRQISAMQMRELESGD